MDLLLAVDGDLLESPVWDDRDQSLLFVDMRRPALHRLAWEGLGLSSFGRGTSASAIAPAAVSGVLVAERDRVTLGTSTPLRMAGDLVLEAPDLRFNDGACDAAGRFWVGTMADDARTGAGCLYVLDTDLTWRVVLKDLSISNGIGWSPDHRRMYHVDSATRRVDVFDFDLDSGEIDNRRPLADTNAYPGIPDGLAVDADGCVWVAFYGGGAVRRFAPDGRVLGEVPVPVPRPTSVCFAGPELDTLVVTVRGDLPQPGGGVTGAHVYAHAPATTGLPTTPFGG